MNHVARSAGRGLRLLLAILSAAAAFGIAPVAASCGAPLAAGGLGSTGSPAAGGIGGTGGPLAGGLGGTGIVGSVTGFGSICVNGHEIAYGADTPVLRDGGVVAPGELAIGQIVAVEAAAQGDAWIARTISVLDAVAGPVTAVDDDGRSLRVLGQPVHADAGTHLASLPSLAALRVDQAVRVAGFRDAAGGIYATRIETVPALDRVAVIGLPRTTADGRLAIGVLTLEMAVPLPAARGELLLRGRLDGGRLLVDQAIADPALPFAGRVGQVVVEGVVAAGPAPATWWLGGFEIELPAGAQAGAMQAGQRVIVSGELLAGNRLQARRIAVHALQPAYGAAGRAMMRGAMPERPVMPERPQRMEHIPLPRFGGGGMGGMGR